MRAVDFPTPGTSDPPAPRPLEETVVEQPGKLMRIAMMVREVLEEVRRAPLDVDAREHLAEIHDRVLSELKTALTGTLADELERITEPFDSSEVPTEAELRIAQAQLLGWLEGLFQGIQAAIATQQMSMAAQLEEMRRRALPPGQERPEGQTPGQYL
jgi:hypothetical protein